MTSNISTVEILHHVEMTPQGSDEMAWTDFRLGTRPWSKVDERTEGVYTFSPIRYHAMSVPASTVISVHHIQPFVGTVGLGGLCDA